MCRPGKPSRPAVAYMHLAKPEFVPVLGELVRSATWEDSSNTYHDPALLFPPFVEKCAFQRIPPPKDRVDSRQGTIDTDPDFMAFLEELANPQGPPSTGPEENGDAPAAPAVTPLIQYLKAKKAANKDKDPGSSKGARSKQDGKSGKSKGSEDSKKAKDKGDKPKEEVKILKKSSADASKESTKGTGSSAKAAPAAAAAASQASSSSEPPKSRRAGIAAAARLLQRDLGLSPGTAHRRARLDAAKAEADTKPPTTPPPAPASKAAAGPSAAASPPPALAAQAPKDQQAKPQASGRSRGRGGKNADKGKGPENSANGPGLTAANPPVLLKKRPEQAAGSQASVSTSCSPAPAPQKPAASGSAGKAGAEKPKPAAAAQKKDKAQGAPGAARGFVKHANPSQGVTEQLLKQALGAFGTVSFVEMDKRKGFAYVDFTEQEGLARAMAASPVAVAQATVQVLERKDKKPAQGAASGAAAGPGASGAGEKEKEKSGHRRRGRRGGGGGGEKSAAGGGGGGSNQGASGSAAG